jgi:tetratricopeptide (TPR) repeat protein
MERKTMRNLKRILIMGICLVILLPLCAQKSPERIARDHHFSADSLYNAREFNQSLEHYQEALKIFNQINSDLTPFEEEINKILFNLYLTCMQIQDWPKAIQFGEEFLLHDPSNEQVISNIAILYRTRLNNNQKALETWKRYDQKYDTYNAKVAIADIYERANDRNNAILWFNKALDINKDADIVRRVAKLYIDNKEPQKAIQFYDDFIATNPNRRVLGTTYRNMGTLYKDMNNTSKAIEKYELALGIEYDKSVSLWLVDQYYHQPNFTKARTHTQNILQRNANDADAIFFNARMLFDEKKFREAKTELQKVINHRTYGPHAKRMIEQIDAGN